MLPPLVRLHDWLLVSLARKRIASEQANDMEDLIPKRTSSIANPTKKVKL